MRKHKYNLATRAGFEAFLAATVQNALDIYEQGLKPATASEFRSRLTEGQKRLYDATRHHAEIALAEGKSIKEVKRNHRFPIESVYLNKITSRAVEDAYHTKARPIESIVNGLRVKVAVKK